MISKTKREERQRELLELLEERDRLAAQLREESKERREDIKALDSRIIHVRDVLAGRAGEQEEIPGTRGVSLAPRQVEKSTRKPSKKFPLGTGLTEECTKCGWPAGDHAGTSCPPPNHTRAASMLSRDDDEPEKVFTVEDAVTGETYTAGRRARR